MSLKVVVVAEKGGQWTDPIEAADEFVVPGDVVEVRLSGRCEMVFVLSDGTQIHSTDID
jgi:hypothetical protein